MRGKNEIKDNFQLWNFRGKEDGDTREGEVRGGKCSETEDEELNC